MSGTSHIAVGVAATAVVVSQIEPEFSFIGMGIALFIAYISSLLPDLDHPKGKAHRLAGPLQFLTRWLARKGIFGRHRTLTHSIIGSIPILILGWFLIFQFDVHVYIAYVGWGFVIGWLFHLFADTLTVAGVRFFWPFWKRSFGLKMCASGGFVDRSLPIIMPLVTAIFIFQRFLPGGSVIQFVQTLV